MLKSFLSNWKLRIVLNSQCSDWLGIKAYVPHSSILDLLLFLIYINDLAEVLKSSAKLFADNTSIFSIVQDPTKFLNERNSDLKIIIN